MSHRLKRNALPLVVFLVGALVILHFTWGPWLLRRAHNRGGGPGPAHDHGTHPSAYEPYDDEPHQREPAPTDPNQLRAILCEHGIPIVDCYLCRYEVGVAGVDPNIGRELLATQTVEVRQMTSRVLELTGEVQLDLMRVVEVASACGGRIETIEKIVGDRVAVGETLAVIQSSEFGQAQADFLENRARLALARQTFEREKSLFEQQVSSHADYLVAESARAAAAAIDAASKQRLQLLGLTDEQIEAFAENHPEESFGRLPINSPIGGTVIDQNVVRGRLVMTTDTLYKVADLSSVWVWCDLYEQDLGDVVRLLAAGEKLTARIHAGAFPSDSFTATVDTIGNEVDYATRTVKLRLTAANPEHKLRPGMFVKVFITLPMAGATVEIPDSAVLNHEGRHFVFTRLDEHLWIRRDVNVGSVRHGVAQVLDGLNPGDVVATRGAFMFKSEILKEKMGAGCAH